MSKVVVLRPEPGASATLARARAAGIDAVAIPLFAVVPMAWEAPDPNAVDALLLTSANAARHGGAGLAGLKQLPTYCVGEATAAAARKAGLKVVGTGVGDANALLEQVPGGLRLLHLTGVNHQVIPGATQLAVYTSQTIDPPPPLDALIGGVAMVHSARAGERLAELVTDRSVIAIAAISKTAADACGGGWQQIEAIAAPTDGALLALASALCQDIRQ